MTFTAEVRNQEEMYRGIKVNMEEVKPRSFRRWCILAAADWAKFQSRLAATPRRNRARVATLRSTMRYEMKGGRR